MTATACLTAAAMLVGSLSAAHGALCQGKRGKLFVRDACRPKERAIAPGTFGEPGPPGVAGSPGAPGDPAAFPLRLVDANGVEVGRIVNFFPGSAVVEVSSPDVPTPLLVGVARSGFPSDTGDPIYYASNDCTGIPYKEGASSDYVDGAAVPPVAQVIGTAAYYASGARQSLSYGSAEFVPFGNEPCPGGTTPTVREACCSGNGGMAVNVFPASRVPLSVYGLVPPFRAVPR